MHCSGEHERLPTGNLANALWRFMQGSSYLRKPPDRVHALHPHLLPPGVVVSPRSALPLPRARTNAREGFFFLERIASHGRRHSRRQVEKKRLAAQIACRVPGVRHGDQVLQQQFILATKELKAMSQRLESITARANIQAVR